MHLAQAKDPVFELSGKKWVIEYHHNNPNIVIEDANIKQTVYIYKCENATIQIKGKVRFSVFLFGSSYVPPGYQDRPLLH